MSGPSASSGRILAIDFGMKRMGLAVSDALGITAQGLPTLERTRMADDLGRIRELTEEYSVERVILGNPVGHSGGCPVELWDERLTSVEAGRMLRQSGMGIEKRKRAVDRVAATLLLQAYLDYHASERARSRKSEESGPEAPGSAEDGQGVDGRTGGVDSGADE